jgi:hypothetical protein
MNNYRVENGRVFYFDDYYFAKPQPMPEADAATFEILDRWFAKDRSHVYFLHKIVPEADPATFAYLGGYDDQWAKDKDRAFHFVPSKAAGRVTSIRSASLDAFEILEDAPFSKYARDAEAVYYCGKRVKDADPATFRMMPSDHLGEKTARSHHFAKDARHVFFDGKILKEADYESLRVVHAPLGLSEYGIDRHQAYGLSPHTGKPVAIPLDRLPAIVREYCKLEAP